MSKLQVVISAPVDTYSGYGARSRDIVKALINSEKYDVRILSQRWGNTRFGYLEDHQEYEISKRLIQAIDGQPHIWIQVTIPNEFQPIGKYNIGITAGIETTVAKAEWIQGLNRMDLNLVSSNHSKQIFEAMSYTEVDNKTQQQKGMLKVEKPIEVLFEGVDLEKYFKTDSKANMEINLDLDSIKESFCYLFVGHWLQGDLGHDRKNIGYTIKLFLETFKNKPTAPALILKTNTATTSIMDRDDILEKIDNIRKQVKAKTLPNIYLLHGDLNDSEMNELYNHPKVKAMLCLSKGEGFGRPMLEFTMTGKPIIASGWSGHVDFLDRNLALLVGGTLEQVHPSAVNQWIDAQAQWYKADDAQATKALKEVYKNYKNYIVNAKKLKHQNKQNFSLEKMQQTLETILENNLPEFPQVVELKMPN